MESASAAVQKSIRLEQAGGADATTLRDTYAYAIAFDPAVQEVFALGSSWPIPSDSSASAPASAPSTSTPWPSAWPNGRDGAELKPFVEDMREKLGKKATRKTNSDPVPAPALVPSAPPRKV